jgi:type I restriction enzyme S subunit
MAGEWRPLRLGDVCTKIGSGATPRGGSEVYLEQGPFALIRSQNVYNDGFHRNGLAYIGEKHAAELEGVEVSRNDVLLNITGDSVARACQVDPCVLPARVNQHVAIIRPDPEKLDPRFLRYVLVSPETQSRLLSWAGAGGTRNALTKAMIESLEFLAPEDVGEQRTIAHILGTLDDRIEANRRMAATLEEMARALFRAWFVTFEPVRAKAEGRWRPGQTLPGLPASLYDTFPDRLVETEHGEIPEGWRWWLLEELAVLHRASLSPGAEPDRVFEHYSIPAYDNGQEPVQDRGETIKSNKILVPADAILLSKLNPESNRVWLPKAESAHPKIASTEFLCFTPKAPAGRALLYCAFRGEPFRRALEGMVTGTSKSHQRVSPDSVLRLQVCPARREVFDGFEKQVWPLLDRTNACREESRILISLRDALLPKLVSGAIRVKDAEAFLKARGL